MVCSDLKGKKWLDWPFEHSDYIIWSYKCVWCEGKIIRSVTIGIRGTVIETFIAKDSPVCKWHIV